MATIRQQSAPALHDIGITLINVFDHDTRFVTGDRSNGTVETRDRFGRPGTLTLQQQSQWVDEREARAVQALYWWLRFSHAISWALRDEAVGEYAVTVIAHQPVEAQTEAA